MHKASFLLLLVVVVITACVWVIPGVDPEPLAETQNMNALLDSAAMQHLGTPYSKLDCSRFVQVTYAEVGILLPRRSTEQYYYVEDAPDSTGLLSRLVFFDTKWTTRVPNHVGIFSIDQDSVYQSISKGVCKTAMNHYWRNRVWPD